MMLINEKKWNMIFTSFEKVLLQKMTEEDQMDEETAGNGRFLDLADLRLFFETEYENDEKENEIEAPS